MSKSNNFAYVTLIFGGNRYLPGVLNLWHSLRKNNSAYDLVCMYANDVPNDSINLLKSLNIKTKYIEYVRIKTKKCVSKKQRERYSKWADVSFTKWQCLNLDYAKIVFIDADMIVVNNPDDIFKFQAPAGVFELQWPIKDMYKNKKKGTVKKDEIRRALYNMGFVATAACMLLEPNKEHFKKLIYMLKNMEPFGMACFSMFDEQAIAYYYSVYNKGPRVNWSHIDNKYAYLLWKHDQTHNKEVSTNSSTNMADVKIIDYFGKYKPWETPPDLWPDLKYWWDSWSTLIDEYPILKDYPIKFVKI